jgi:adenylate/guanylate cyclase family protein
MGADEAGTLARLKALRKELINPRIARHCGRTIKLMGDGALVEFPSVVEAVECAVEAQQVTAEHQAGVAEEKRIAFRIGINLGDVIIEGNDIYGDSVNLAARLQALAEPGGLCISGTVHDQIRDKLPYTFGPGRADGQEHRAPGARLCSVGRQHRRAAPGRGRVATDRIVTASAFRRVAHPCCGMRSTGHWRGWCMVAEQRRAGATQDADSCSGARSCSATLAVAARRCAATLDGGAAVRQPEPRPD